MRTPILAAFVLSAITSFVTYAGELRAEFVDRIIGVSVFTFTCGGEQEFEIANDNTTDPFSIELDLTQSCSGGSSNAQSRHDSTIGPQAIHGSGVGVATAQLESAVRASCQGFAYFITDFEIDQATPFTLTGHVALRGDSIPRTGSVALAGPAGTIAEFTVSGTSADPTHLPFYRTGQLPPGRYMLVSAAQASIDGTGLPATSGQGEFEMLLALTDCLCDLDASGDVGLQDLALLLANFGVSDATLDEGDFDADGVVDIRDLARLLGRFGEVCQ